MTIPQMLAVHNELAKRRGADPLKVWKGSHVQLAQKTAILRTQKVVEVVKRSPVVVPKREQPIRDTILKLLSVVDYYEEKKTRRRVTKRTAAKRPKDFVSVGLSYEEIRKRLIAAHPHTATGSTTTTLRWTANKVRSKRAGFEKCKLPDKRPHGTPKDKR